MIETPALLERRADGMGAPIPRAIWPHRTAGVAKIRVRVTHGVPVIGSGVIAILAKSSELELVASTDAADVLITDVEAGLRALANGNANRNVLIVAQDDAESTIRRALGKGVRGFLLDTCGAEELTSAVKTVSRGGTAFAPVVADRIVQGFTFDQLTARELDVLHLMVHGLSDKDIARKLLIALGTVKSHVRAILTKLGASRRTEAAAIAQRRGLARLDGPLERMTA